MPACFPQLTSWRSWSSAGGAGRNGHFSEIRVVIILGSVINKASRGSRLFLGNALSMKCSESGEDLMSKRHPPRWLSAPSDRSRGVLLLAAITLLVIHKPVLA